MSASRSLHVAKISDGILIFKAGTSYIVIQYI